MYFTPKNSSVVNRKTDNWNKRLLRAFVFLVIIIIAGITLESTVWNSAAEPWTKDQLMEPADLAQRINDGKDADILIYSIGPSPIIKHSINIGATRNADNLKKLETALQKLPKNQELVIYCGCCPFKNCPNVRPAFSLLNKMKFTNHKLLNLPRNIKSDWIDKGYPMMV